MDCKSFSKKEEEHVDLEDAQRKLSYFNCMTAGEGKKIVCHVRMIITTTVLISMFECCCYCCYYYL